MGDALLAAAFVSYAGPFNMEFRKRLVSEKWLPDLTERQIPLTSGFMPLDMLADESSKVHYKTQLGLYSLYQSSCLISPDACMQGQDGADPASTCTVSGCTFSNKVAMQDHNPCLYLPRERPCLSWCFEYQKV